MSQKQGLPGAFLPPFHRKTAVKIPPFARKQRYLTDFIPLLSQKQGQPTVKITPFSEKQGYCT